MAVFPLRFQLVRTEELELAHVPADARAHPRCAAAVTWKTPWLLMCGRADNGQSVALYVGGKLPYLFVEAPDGVAPADLRAWVAARVQRTVVDVRAETQWTSLDGGEPVTVLRVTLANPRDVARVRDVWHTELQRRVWEADVKFPVRFEIDCGAKPYYWIEVDAVRLERTDGEADIKAVCYHEDVRPQPCTGTNASNAQLPAISFDIECDGQGEFPDARRHRCIMISAVRVHDCTGSWEPSNIAEMVVFLADERPIAPVTVEQVPVRVVACATEASMLRHFAAYIVAHQPDKITQYNGDKFDWPYLVERARQLGVEGDFVDMGRVQGPRMRVEQSSFRSGARGVEDDTNVVLPGIINFDVCREVRRMRLRSFKLDFVARKLLGVEEGKDAVHYTEITPLYNGSAADRARLAHYCVVDAVLALRLALHLKLVTNFISMGRVTGIDMHAQITGGQGVKVHNLLLREGRGRNILVPTRPRTNAVGDGSKAYEGATVVDPLRGYYNCPVTTLDFSSLYPSIMIEHNLCYTTLVTSGQCPHGRDVASGAADGCCVTCTPIGVRFWRKSVRIGVLPKILSDLLAARKHAKGEMERWEAIAGPEAKRMASIWNALQLAFKVVANSIYGFTGAVVGKLPCLEISASVTAFGRTMIAYIIGLVERVYCKGATLVPGIPPLTADARVLYGDTDSIMVQFGVASVADGMAVGRHAASFINAAFRVRYLPTDEAVALQARIAPAYASLEAALIDNPAHYVALMLAMCISAIAIVFEKVLFPYLLINKKRYAGPFFMSNPDKPDKLHQAGLESVRRDNAQFTAATVDRVLRILLSDRNPHAALAFARAQVRRLVLGTVPVADLVSSKGFSKPASEYANAASQPHLRVNALRAERAPGSQFTLGDRIPYLVVRRGPYKASTFKLVDAVEDVEYAVAHKQPILTEYYIDNQLRKPLTRIFDTVWGAGATDVLLFAPDVVMPNRPLSPFARATDTIGTAVEPDAVVAALVDDLQRRRANRAPAPPTTRQATLFGAPPPKPPAKAAPKRRVVPAKPAPKQPLLKRPAPSEETDDDEMLY